MKNVEIISFDLDGTLVNYDFVNSIWFDGIPSLYSKKYNLSFKDAYEYVRNEYDKIGMERIEWYNLQYWLNLFNLEQDALLLLSSFKSRIKCYPDSLRTLKRLEPNYKLAIITNSPQEFLDFEVRKTGIAGYIDNIFSAISDFGEVKKNMQIYSKIIQILNISPKRIIHIGDNWKFDYLVPRELGIESFYLDREKEKTGKFIVHDLDEFSDKIYEK